MNIGETKLAHLEGKEDLTRNMMALGKTEFAKLRGKSDLTDRMMDLVKSAEKYGACEGARRLIFICDNYQRLTPELAYRWLDPLAFQHEVEDAQAQKVWWLHVIRNCASVFPLIWTWSALAWALWGLQHDKNPHDAGQSFLLLWQDGFHNGSVVPFSTAALIDVVLLLLYIGLIVMTSWADKQAYNASTNFAQELHSITEELISFIGKRHFPPSSYNEQSSSQPLTLALQQGIDDTIEANERIIAQITADNKQSLAELGQLFQSQFTEGTQVLKDAINLLSNESKNAIKGLYDRSETVFTQVSEAVNSFASSTQKLEAILQSYQRDAQYFETGQDTGKNIEQLKETMSAVLQQIGAIPDSLSRSATEMGKSTQAIEKVAEKIESGIQHTLSDMSTKVTEATTSMSEGLQQSMDSLKISVSETVLVMEKATNELRDVAPTLQLAADSLQVTVTKLASLPAFVSNSKGNARGFRNALRNFFRELSRRLKQ